MDDPMPEDAAARLTVLEERFCHQTQLIDALDAALVAQQKTIDRLTARLARLEQLTLEHRDQLSQAPPDEKPPHY
jgi:uncharacterized coiled-coil protein SlyX